MECFRRLIFTVFTFGELTVKLHFERSTKWCKAQAIATGQDFHERAELHVDPTDLTLEAREILVGLSSGGLYPADIRAIGFHPDWTRTAAYSGYGSRSFRIDSDNPTAAEISAAIVAASEEIDSKHAAETAEKASKAAKAQRIEELKAELAELEA